MEQNKANLFDLHPTVSHNCLTLQGFHMTHRYGKYFILSVTLELVTLKQETVVFKGNLVTHVTMPGFRT